MTRSYMIGRIIVHESIKSYKIPVLFLKCKIRHTNNSE